MTIQEVMNEIRHIEEKTYTRAKRNSLRHDELERDGDEDASLLAAGRTFAYWKVYNELKELIDRAHKEGVA